MSPEVIARKLQLMARYAGDLKPYEQSTFKEFWTDHYKVERLIELIVMTASDIVLHLLVMKGESPPGSYRAAFLRAGELGLLSTSLSKSLASGAGLRNLLTHEYEEIDHRILHGSLPIIVKDAFQFMEEISHLPEL